MLTLTSPQILFDNKKLFSINGHADEKFSKTASFRALLIYEYSEPELPESLKSMTAKMLHACRFKPEETAFINLKYEKNISIGQLLSLNKPELVIIFGNINPARNMAGLKKNTPYTFGTLKMLRTEKLDYLDKNANEKEAFWHSLKKMLQL